MGYHVDLRRALSMYSNDTAPYMSLLSEHSRCLSVDLGIPVLHLEGGRAASEGLGAELVRCQELASQSTNDSKILH